MVDESITPGKKPDTDTGEASLPLLVDKTGSGPVPGSATSGNPRSNLKYLRFIPLVMLAMAFALIAFPQIALFLPNALN